MVTLGSFLKPLVKVECKGYMLFIKKNKYNFTCRKKEREEGKNARFLLCHGISCAPHRSPCGTKAKILLTSQHKKARKTPDSPEARWKDTEWGLWMGPDKHAVSLIRSERAFLESHDFFFPLYFFFNRGRYCHSESPRLFWKQAKINSPLVEAKWISPCWM